MPDTEFVLFGYQHCAAIAATAIAAFFMIRLNRSPSAPFKVKRAANITLAVILITCALCDPLWLWLRYRAEPDYALMMVCGNGLPLHLCDVLAILLAWTLMHPQQRGAEFGYLGGMAGTLQGLLTPTVKYGWDSPEYWNFFGQHGGVPVAALALVFGAGFRPQPGALRRAMCWGWLYMATASLINWLLGTNYGYFNRPPEAPSLLDYMGPWPWYLVTLQGVAMLFFFLLLLPFRKPRSLTL